MTIHRPRTLGGVTNAIAATVALAVAWLGLGVAPAQAVPAFAVQTGQPCQTCHIGGFGPQLTKFGREFKLGGYTMRAVKFNVPVSIAAIASYVQTQKSAGPPAPDYAANDNFTLDQINLFIAGGINAHLGGFIQATYDGVARAFTWDNLDLRAVTTTQIKGANVVLGASLNNAPTVEDVWNTLPAWGYPYTSSGLAPGAPAAPLLSGALFQTTLGMTGYAWINSEFYLEGGAYGSPSAQTLTRLGSAPSVGVIRNLAPYARIAYQKSFDASNLQVGAFGMQADIYPGAVQSFGADHYTDLGLDASYQLTRHNSDTVTFNARYIHERQALDASLAMGLAANAHDSLDDLRADASYYWRDKIGGTFQAFTTRGSSDAGLYAGCCASTLKPDTTGLMFQIDGTPWGAGGSPFGPRFNMRVGVQYTLYTQFSGAGSNYDGAGSNASGNNTLRVFTWFAY